MAVGSLSPVAVQAFYDANGNPLAGGSLSLYLAGTSTPSPAYADQGLTTPLANPVILDAAGRAPELYLDALSYKQVLKNALGTIIWTADNIRSATLLAQSTFQPVLTTIVSTGTIHNVATSPGHNRVLSCANTAGDVTITGVAAGADGDLLLVLATGSGNVFLNHDDVGSSVGNRLTNSCRSGPTPLVGGYGLALYQYLAVIQHWRLIQHNQGHFIQVPYNAANFFCDAAGTWTVPSASVFECRYLLEGSTIQVTVTLGPTTVGGAPVSLSIAGWPYSFISSAVGQPGQHTAWTVVDGPAYVSGIARVFLNDGAVQIVKPSFAPFVVSSGSYVLGQARFEVQ